MITSSYELMDPEFFDFELKKEDLRDNFYYGDRKSVV